MKETYSHSSGCDEPITSVNNHSFCNSTFNKTIEALTRATYGKIFVVDFEENNVSYCPQSLLYINEFKCENDKEHGICLNKNITIQADHRILSIISKVVLPYYQQLPADERINYITNYDVHVMNEEKKEILLNHKIIPIELTQNGHIRTAIVHLSLSLQKCSGNIQISSHLSDIVWKYDLHQGKLSKTIKKKLTTKEIDVLRFYLQGLTIPEIADKVHLSIDTVKWHRRKLLEKLDVKNISEALAYAVTNNMI
ncbi:helix-turn-helix transcriptional regulator [Chryseobacterium sp. Leaf394]|uniref:response regulator transcription factor n=1 Tax=Chryseobacterium sp. Leaf394 TaxID=1736361 RepID=UPI0006F6E62E|nr:helix-turn-helix transcriptional regulator [Chryseobacterium sp. Leaf394]KQS91653.1 hypothetical protein ASG21_04085 [Chryseobacterium sp. Leaf394]